MQNEEKYRTLVENIPHVVWTIDQKGNTTFVNSKVENVCGYTPEEIYAAGNRFWLDGIHPGDIEKAKSACESLFKSNTMFDIEYRIKRKDGNWIWIHDRAIATYKKDGVMYADGVFTDVTERKMEATLLKKRKSLLDESQQITHVGSLELDVVKNELCGTDEAYRIFGLIPQNTPCSYKTFLNCIHPEDRRFVDESVHDTLRNEKPLDIEHRILLKDGTVRIIHTKGAIAFDDAGMPVRMVGTVHDITERKRAVEEMHLLLTITKSIAEAEEYNAALYAAVRQVCEATGWIYGEAWLPSPDGQRLECCLTWHSSSENLEEFSKKTKEFTFPPGIGMPGRVWISKKPEWRKDATIDGDFPRANITKESGLKAAMSIPIIAKDKVIAVLGFFVRRQRNEDERLIGLVSSVATQLGVAIERKQMEEETAKLKDLLYHAQKLASVGTLAGGVAHNFNNLLTVVMGYASLLLAELKEGDPLREYAQNILSSSQIAANLTQDLLAFSRKQPSNPQPTKLNDFLEKVKPLLSKYIRANIKLRVVLTVKDCVVMADSEQIKQILMNLATNAGDAMPNGGELNICTDIVEIDTTFIKAHGFGAIGKYALISVTDTGMGMDENTRLQIFEPFFTTKEVGRGTGLGLAIVYGLVKQHNGYIEVDSAPGKGAAFRIYLPLIESEAQMAKAEAHAITHKVGTGTILLAEDESVVRELVKIVFEGAGFQVIEAVDGEDAIDKFIKHKDDIALLVFDFIMPRKNGKEAYDTIKNMRPDVKVLFLSGYDEEVISKTGIHKEGLDYILKPVSPMEILEKVRALLDKL
ncbi:MAG TPA: PAS domain-containing protein [Candidatus Brocadiaceae bacterium]|nr:PAS domain-containing protein [Candidatus Brocadiaceae bacterium]